VVLGLSGVDCHNVGLQGERNWDFKFPIPVVIATEERIDK
jgi:hypothetical protein